MNSINLSWRRPIWYRNQSTDLWSKLMDWFLYHIGLRHERVKEARKKKNLNISQRQAAIKLIEKKDRGKCYIKNWCPISLLNVDYKIMSKAKNLVLSMQELQSHISILKKMRVKEIQFLRIVLFYVLKFYFCLLNLIIKFVAWTFSNILTYIQLMRMIPHFFEK